LNDGFGSPQWILQADAEATESGADRAQRDDAGRWIRASDGGEIAMDPFRWRDSKIVVMGAGLGN
jgi:hypothetical protein